MVYWLTWPWDRCYLHGKKPKIIHRDLSANNILLTSDMKAKIADLGLAKILNATPAQSRCPGTVAYMPPEALVQNPEYCTEIDVFSYGVLAIHILCGKWPHPDEPKRQNNDGTLEACSEYERREKYIDGLGSNHPMIRLIETCLSDNRTKRPNAEAILGYVQGVASKCPYKYESTLALLKRVESLTGQLAQEQRQQRMFCDLNSKTKLKCDTLQSQLRHCQAECSQLKLEQDGERKKYSNKVCQFKTVHKMKADAENELNDSKVSLVLRNKKISNLEKMVQEQRKEIKAKSGELKYLSEQQTFLKEQIAAMEAQLVLLREREEISDRSEAKLKQGSSSGKFKQCEQQQKETSMGNELQYLKEKTKKRDLEETIETEAKEKNTELEVRGEQIRMLEAQIKTISDRKEVAVKCLKSQLDSLSAQIDCLNEQLEASKLEQEADKRVREWDERKADELSRQKELTENLRLELDIVKNCQIRNLQQEVTEKEEFIRELTLQQQRAQRFCFSKVSWEMTIQEPMW